MSFTEEKLKKNTFEDFLKDSHAKNYIGVDDDMPDDFDYWLGELEAEDYIYYADKYAEAQKQLIKDELGKKAFIPEFGANHHWTNGAVKYLTLNQAINLIENL